VADGFHGGGDALWHTCTIGGHVRSAGEEGRVLSERTTPHESGPPRRKTAAHPTPSDGILYARFRPENGELFKNKGLLDPARRKFLQLPGHPFINHLIHLSGMSLAPDFWLIS
jgi:hypothetical protein